MTENDLGVFLSDHRLSVAEGARRVLVADDDNDSTDMLSTYLELQGHEVRTAGSGADAVDVANDFCPNIIFLDLCMPDADGWEVCERLRATSADVEQAAIIAVTGHPQNLEPNKIRSVRFDAYLVKPLELEMIGKIVDCSPAAA